MIGDKDILSPSQQIRLDLIAAAPQSAAVVKR
jgi:hypothetical protein